MFVLRVARGGVKVYWESVTNLADVVTEALMALWMSRLATGAACACGRCGAVRVLRAMCYF